MYICDKITEVYLNILNGKNIDCFIADEDKSFFEIIEECEKRLETRKIESFDMIILNMVDKNVMKSWYALEQLQIGEYTQTIGVMDIPPQILLDIIKNCYLKPIFYCGRKHANNLKIKNICEQYGIAFMSNQSLKID